MKTHRWINDPGLPTIEQQKPWLPPRIGSDWLCKRGKGTELNEVAGYQLAVAMQIPVPDHRFFMVATHDVNELPIDAGIAPQKTGLLIKEVTGTKTNYSQLLQFDADSGIQHLGLRLFSTSEWPELLQTEMGALAIDLEFVLAHLAIPNLDSELVLNGAIEAYRNQTRCVFMTCYEETEKLGLVSSFLEKLPKLLDQANRFYWPDFGPLNQGRQIADFYRKSYEARSTSLLDMVAILT